MMYLQNILKFCQAGEVAFRDGKYYFGDSEFTTFISFFLYVSDVYSMSGTIDYVDWEFEFLSNTAYDATSKFKIDDDAEFVRMLLNRVYDELGKNDDLDNLMSRLYWAFQNNEVDVAWNALVAYNRKALGA